MKVAPPDCNSGSRARANIAKFARAAAFKWNHLKADQVLFVNLRGAPWHPQRVGVERASPNTALDHDDFGLNQSKIIVIDSNSLERDGTENR
jgi:hypothetical protein